MAQAQVNLLIILEAALQHLVDTWCNTQSDQTLQAINREIQNIFNLGGWREGEDIRRRVKRSCHPIRQRQLAKAWTWPQVQDWD